MDFLLQASLALAVSVSDELEEKLQLEVPGG